MAIITEGLETELLSFVGWYEKNPLTMTFAWDTSVVESRAGFEQRLVKWTQPKRTWQINYNIMLEEHRNKILQMFNDSRGGAEVFILKDRWDYTAQCSFEHLAAGATYQLEKKYTTWTELKKRISPSNFSVTLNGATLAAEAYSLSCATGKLQVFSDVPGTLVVNYEFYFTVRFQASTITDTHAYWRIWEYSPLELVEVKV